uniref:Secreted protein n=1 Tax=Ixodes ricinus TaxID=34613 RepID=A0A6B0UTC9_IXORI
MGRVPRGQSHLRWLLLCICAHNFSLQQMLKFLEDGARPPMSNHGPIHPGDKVILQINASIGSDAEVKPRRQPPGQFCTLHGWSFRLPVLVARTCALSFPPHPGPRLERTVGLLSPDGSRCLGYLLRKLRNAFVELPS